MALSAETVRKRRSLDQARKGYAAVKTSTTIYKGALVSRQESDGLIVPASAATGEAFAGVSVSDTCTGASDGSVYCEFMWGHEELITAKTALTTTYLNCEVVAFDDDQVTVVTAVSTAKRAFVGYATEFDSSGNCWVKVDPTSGQKTAP